MFENIFLPNITTFSSMRCKLKNSVGPKSRQQFKTQCKQGFTTKTQWRATMSAGVYGLSQSITASASWRLHHALCGTKLTYAK